MRKLITIFFVALGIALLNRALSFLGPINLIWVVGLVIFSSLNEGSGILFIVVAGLFNDFLFHQNVGLTALPVLISLVLYVLIRSSRVGDDFLQKLLLILLSLFGCFVISVLIRALFLGDSLSGFVNFVYWKNEYLINSMLTLILFIIFNKQRSSNDGLKRLKI